MRLNPAAVVLRMSGMTLTVGRLNDPYVGTSVQRGAQVHYPISSMTDIQSAAAEIRRGKKEELEMWANAQRDGRPAEYRWRPLFNAAKFG